MKKEKLVLVSFTSRKTCPCCGERISIKVPFKNGLPDLESITIEHRSLQKALD